MPNIIEILQPLPDSRILISPNKTGKNLEIFNYKKERTFFVSLKNNEAGWLASALDDLPATQNRIILDNGQILRVLKQDIVRQMIISNVLEDKEISAQLGVIFIEVLGKVIKGLQI